MAHGVWFDEFSAFKVSYQIASSHSFCFQCLTLFKMSLKAFCFGFILTFCQITYSYQNVSPKLDEFHPKRSQKVGTKFSILCSPQEGSKPFQFGWLKNGIIFEDSSSKYKIDTTEDASLLMISSLSVYDTANYTCTVRNSFGDDSQSTFLTVKGLICQFEFF